MHELAIARSLVEAAGETAIARNAITVRRLRCRIGDLRQVNEWLLQEAFAVCRAGTLCKDAELVIEKTVMTAGCALCRSRFSIQGGRWHCPKCGTGARDLAGGDELELASIEIETDDATMMDRRAESNQKVGATS